MAVSNIDNAQASGHLSCGQAGGHTKYVGYLRTRLMQITDQQKAAK